MLRWRRGRCSSSLLVQRFVQEEVTLLGRFPYYPSNATTPYTVKCMTLLLSPANIFHRPRMLVAALNVSNFIAVGVAMRKNEQKEKGQTNFEPFYRRPSQRFFNYLQSFEIGSLNARSYFLSTFTLFKKM